VNGILQNNAGMLKRKNTLQIQAAILTWSDLLRPNQTIQAIQQFAALYKKKFYRCSGTND